MIPKKIHYFWFGENKKSDLVMKCINSWKKYCPDYEIIEWNESNYDVHKNEYMEQAYLAKRWGFVSDYARLDIIYNYGGIYLDTDVEIIRPFDIGFEKKQVSSNSFFVNTGQGFGAEALNPGIKKMLDVYDNIFFFKDGRENLKTCPYYNTEALVGLGMKQENVYQNIRGIISIYPSEYFCPINWKNQKCEITKNTYSIHHFNASWLSKEEKRKRKIQRKIDYIIHIPNLILLSIFGKKRYETIKRKIRRKN